MKKLLSIILVLLSVAIMMCGCNSEEKQKTEKAKESITNTDTSVDTPADTGLDFRNTDDENLQLAVKVVDDIYESEIESCYKAKEGEYPEPDEDGGKPIKDFYKFTLKNKATVTVGALAERVFVAIKTFSNGRFRNVDVTPTGCIITDETYGQ